MIANVIKIVDENDNIIPDKQIRLLLENRDTDNPYIKVMIQGIDNQFNKSELLDLLDLVIKAIEYGYPPEIMKSYIHLYEKIWELIEKENDK